MKNILLTIFFLLSLSINAQILHDVDIVLVVNKLHPSKKAFEEIAKVYISIINDKKHTDKRVFSVVDFYRDKIKEN